MTDRLRNFEITKGKFGFKVDSVAEYIDLVEIEVETLERKNAELEGKIEILASKLEEILVNEQSIKDAMLSAQKLKESLVSDANIEADRIIRDAKISAKNCIIEAQKKISDELITYKKLKDDIADFKASLFSIYKEHLDKIGDLPTDSNTVNYRIDSMDLSNYTDESKEVALPEQEINEEHVAASLALEFESEPTSEEMIVDFAIAIDEE